jgi:hypothetical protein
VKKQQVNDPDSKGRFRLQIQRFFSLGKLEIEDYEIIHPKETTRILERGYHEKMNEKMTVEEFASAFEEKKQTRARGWLCFCSRSLPKSEHPQPSDSSICLLSHGDF